MCVSSVRFCTEPKRKDFGGDAVSGAVFAQFFFNGVQGEFGQLEQQQPFGAAADNLAAEFRTDGAARAGYHDGFAFGVGIHEAVVGCDGIAPEQVGHRDF